MGEHGFRYQPKALLSVLRSPEAVPNPPGATFAPEPMPSLPLLKGHSKGT